MGRLSTTLRAAAPLAAALGAACSAVVDADGLRSASGDGAPSGNGAGGRDGGSAAPQISPSAPLLEGERAVYAFSGLSTGAGDELVASSTHAAITSFRRASDGSSGAFVLRAPVDDTAREGDATSVNIALVRAGVEVAQVGTIRVSGLDEARLEGEVRVGDLRPAYSRVEIPSAGVRFVGATVARVYATDELRIAGPVDVSAGLAPEPGPGGGAGGASGSDGGGPAPGGGGGDAPCPGPGGGGSNRGPGSAAEGELGGGAPPELGSDAALLDRVGSGGGGGGADGDSRGQPGGGGGGGVVLRSQGRLTWIGQLSARGGDGPDSQRLGCGQSFGAAGGGGSGGLIVLRAEEPLAGAGAVDVSGGAGGRDDPKAGGAGGAGWLYVGIPGQLIGAALSAERLVAWALPDPPIVDAGVEVAVPVWAEPGHRLRVTVDGDPAPELSADEQGRATWQGALSGGVHELCAADLDGPAAAPSCARLVALP